METSADLGLGNCTAP